MSLCPANKLKELVIIQCWQSLRHGIRYQLCLWLCVSMSMCCERKMARVINAILGRRIVRGTTRSTHWPEVKGQGHVVIKCNAGVGLQVARTAWVSSYVWRGSDSEQPRWYQQRPVVGSVCVDVGWWIAVHRCHPTCDDGRPVCSSDILVTITETETEMIFITKISLVCCLLSVSGGNVNIIIKRIYTAK